MNPFGSILDVGGGTSEPDAAEAAEAAEAPLGEPGFDASRLPEPGPFLREGRVLVGAAHDAVHARSRELFAERGVHDATFGYNLAALNRDARHPDAGVRYAECEGGDALRVAFTPTSPFCPQAVPLARGVAAAWRSADDYGRVRVRLCDHRADGEVGEPDGET
jgi:hypothetical protein